MCVRVCILIQVVLGELAPTPGNSVSVVSVKVSVFFNQVSYVVTSNSCINFSNHSGL